MAIQVWDGTKYVGAELAKFGPTGTLKEALIWDGTKYVKVWPSGPSYPITGEWSGVAPSLTWVTIHQWSVPETGSYTISGTAYSASTQTLSLGISRNDPTFQGFLAADERYDPGTVAASHTGTFQAGDTLYWGVFNYPAGTASATWTIGKN